jgi:hypothetical protein
VESTKPLGADISIDHNGIHLYRDIDAYYDADDPEFSRITLEPQQAAALGRFLMAVSNAE